MMPRRTKLAAVLAVAVAALPLLGPPCLAFGETDIHNGLGQNVEQRFTGSGHTILRSYDPDRGTLTGLAVRTPDGYPVPGRQAPR